MAALASNYETIIGIDLGTTYSCVSYFNTETNTTEVIPTPHGRTMPSWVAFTAEGKTVGHPAKSQVASNPNNTVYDIKRIIGRGFTDEVVQEEKEKFPFKVMDGGNGDCRVVVDWRGSKKSLSPEEISSFILAELKLAAEKHLGKAITKVPQFSLTYHLFSTSLTPTHPHRPSSPSLLTSTTSSARLPRMPDASLASRSSASSTSPPPPPSRTACTPTRRRPLAPPRPTSPTCSFSTSVEEPSMSPASP